MIVRTLGRQPYAGIEEAMRSFTARRTPDTADELWLVEHDPVFTQGLAGRPEHVLVAGDIPIVQTQRGGQVTYHGPGQVTAYPLVDLQRLGIYVKEYVFRLEEAVLRTLAQHGVTGHRVARRASTFAWPTPSTTRCCPRWRRGPTPLPAWARSPPWASR